MEHPCARLLLVLRSTSFWPVYLGFLSVLEEGGVPLQGIVGSGSGAFVASLYAFRPDAQWVIEFFRKKVEEGLWEYLSFEKEMLDLPPPPGWLRWKKQEKTPQLFRSFFPSFFEGARLEEGILELGIRVFHFPSKEEKYFFQGDLSEVLLGSLAYPGRFLPHSTPQGGLADPYFTASLGLGELRRFSTPCLLVPLPLPWLSSSLWEKLFTHLHQSFTYLWYLHQERALKKEAQEADWNVVFHLPFLDSFGVEEFEALVERGREECEKNFLSLVEVVGL